MTDKVAQLCNLCNFLGVMNFFLHFFAKKFAKGNFFIVSLHRFSKNNTDGHHQISNGLTDSLHFRKNWEHHLLHPQWQTMCSACQSKHPYGGISSHYRVIYESLTSLNNYYPLITNPYPLSIGIEGPRRLLAQAIVGGESGGIGRPSV